MVRLTGLALLSIFVLGDVAAAQSIAEHRRRCNAPQQDCGGLPDGPRLSQCLLNNANIEHSCNAVMRDEQRTGQGPKFNAAKQKSQNTNRRMEADDE
jgi:hypothetical protein